MQVYFIPLQLLNIPQKLSLCGVQENLHNASSKFYAFNGLVVSQVQKNSSLAVFYYITCMLDI